MKIETEYDPCVERLEYSTDARCFFFKYTERTMDVTSTSRLPVCGLVTRTRTAGTSSRFHLEVYFNTMSVDRSSDNTNMNFQIQVQEFVLIRLGPSSSIHRNNTRFISGFSYGIEET